MDRIFPLLKVLALGALAIALSILFFPFIVPGMLLSQVVKGRHERWVLPVAALLIAVTWRMVFGSWIVHLGKDSPAEWFVELVQGILNWAFGSIFVTAGFRMPRTFKEGLRSRPSPQDISEASR